ncbi:MAG: aldo/keto reductase [Rhizobiaceae bacterium]
MEAVAANGADMPVLGFGTWQLRGDACSSLVKQAIETGYTHIDTAIMYENEEEVGEGIRASGKARDRLFITTKVWPDQLSDGAFQENVEASLKRLDLSYVDLVLIHWPPKGRKDTADWMRLLNDVAQRGYTHHIGVSNFTTRMIEESVAASQRSLACNQVENHPYLDQRKVRAMCDRHGLALVAYCPLYRDGGLFSEPAIANAASTHGKSPAQIVLRWHIQSGGVAIPKTAKPSRLSENIDIFDFALSGAEMAAINALRARNSRLCDFEFSPDWDDV